MKKILYSVVSFCIMLLPITITGSAQDIDTFYLQKPTFTEKIDKLRIHYGQNKIIPVSLETECLAALSFYPELKNIHIEFKFGSPISTMKSLPKLTSLLQKRINHSYTIIIKKQGTTKNGLEWSALSFNALVGWIGHELGHVLHYSNKTSGGILITGVKYVFAPYRKKMEHFTDQLAIQHNLGMALYEGTDFTLNHSNATEKYKEYLKKYYLLPIEILRLNENKDATVVSFNKTKCVVSR